MDSTGSVGYYTSLALDSADNPHISYRGGSYGNLKYAHWDGSSWQTEIVGSAIRVSWSLFMSLDSSDYPHISYHDSTNDNLGYARWDGSNWQTEAVDEPGDVGWYTSLALDSSGNPHISYHDRTNYDLKYARWDTPLAGFSLLSPTDGETVHDWPLADWEDSVGYPSVTYKLWYSTASDFSHYSFVPGLTDSEFQFSDSRLDRDTTYYWKVKASDDDEETWSTETDWWFHVADDVGVEFVSLFAEATDEGVLLSWSIVGDEPASVSVLRAVSSDVLTQNGSVALSGELSGLATSWLDVSVEAGAEYAYYLEVTELDGTVSRFGPSEVVVPGMVSELALSDPYPNPADESLTIHYSLTNNGTLSLNIYDVAGRLVETLVSGEQTAGRHSVSWDSSVAATGVYLLRLEANGEAITKRAVISR